MSETTTKPIDGMKEIKIGTGKRSVNFDELVRIVSEQKDTKFDVVLPTDDMEAIVQPQAEYEDETAKVPAEVRLQLNLPNGHGTQALPMTGHAHRQLAEKCGIPIRYYDRMLEAGKHDLLVHNVNEWIKSKDTRMIRMLGGQVRAILSDKYFRLDNYIVVNETFNKMEEHGLNWRDPEVVQSCHLTETKMYVRIVIPYMQSEIRKDDVVKQGLIISNSEVGAGAFKAEPFLYRLVCKNGLIAKHSMARVHLGSKLKAGELDLDIFSDETRELELETVLSQIRDIIEHTFDQDFFHKWTDILQRNSEVEIQSPTEAIDNFCTMYSMKHQKEDLLDRLVKEGDSTQYGLVNAITSYARDLENVEKQVELERIAGDISFMEEPEFRRKIAPVAVA